MKTNEKYLKLSARSYNFAFKLSPVLVEVGVMIGYNYDQDQSLNDMIDRLGKELDRLLEPEESGQDPDR